jgi:membrane-associated protease RseP (regulator of RpoE activity)
MARPFERRTNMKGWRAAALAASLAAAAGAGAAMAPAAVHGQARARVQAPHVEILGGGSRLGVSIRDLEASEAKDAKGAAAGVVVEDVSDESPALKAGLRKGDVIVEFDGERVRSARQLTRLVRETPAGRSVQAIVLREGQRTTLTVTPEAGGRFSFEHFEDLEELGRAFRYRMPALPEAPPVPARPARPPTPPPPPSGWNLDELLERSGRLGATVRSLSPQLAEYFGTKSGVLVSSVDEESAAAKAGLRAGDVITSFNGAAIDNPADVRRQVQQLKDGDAFTIEVMRDRKPMTLKGTAEPTGRGRTGRTIL